MSGEPKDHKATCPICQKVLYGAWSKTVAYKMTAHIKKHGKRKVADFVRQTYDVDQHLMDTFAFHLASRSEDKDYAMGIIVEKEKIDRLPGVGPASVKVLEECARIAYSGGYEVMRQCPRMPVLVKHGLVISLSEKRGYGMTVKGFRYLRNWGSNGTRT